MPASPESRPQSDVVVVGGGPAGCAAAHAAAKAGLRATLVERGAALRDKVCGDMFLPSAIDVLGRLGLGTVALEACGGIRVPAIDLAGERGRLWRRTYPKAPVWILRRKLIDQALRDALPREVAVLYGANVSEIEARGSAAFRLSVRLREGSSRELDCGSVVLACGAQNALSQRWGVSGDPIAAPSISAYIDGADQEIPLFEFSAECPSGYRWLFPMGEGKANVGVFVPARASGAVMKALGRSFVERRQGAGRVSWRGGLGALWSGRGKVWHNNAGLVSCGDAAGLIDPLTGEGITAALLSGVAAGNAIGAFLHGNRDCRLLEIYSSWMARTFSHLYAPSPLRRAWRRLAGATR
jgi:flavin-dependent dehydrogenase